MTNLRLIGLIIFLSMGWYASNAQHRLNLNNWYVGGHLGYNVGHMDIRPAGFQEYYQNPSEHFGLVWSPEVSYHFTHGFAVVTNFTYLRVRSNEFNRQDASWPLREYDTRLNEFKILGHLNLGRALSFNKRKNTISPYVNFGVGASKGVFKAPLSRVESNRAPQILTREFGDTTSFTTWNKNLQVGFFIYGNRWIDFDIRYNYTFFNEDYVDGSDPETVWNREWDKYSYLAVGFRFKFGTNNRRTYEHTSWAREPMEEDTSLFNNYVEIEEYDDGTGDPVFRIRRGNTNINEENLTKIDANENNEEDLYQAIYNTLMDNPDLKDSIMAAVTRDIQADPNLKDSIKAAVTREMRMVQGPGPTYNDSMIAALARELRNNPAFISKVQDSLCIECEGEGTIVYVNGEKRVVREGEVINTTVVREGELSDKPDSVNSGRLNAGDSLDSGSGSNSISYRRNIDKPDGIIEEFELRNIYYDLDASFIREDATESLDELVKVLKKYPGLKIELGSHTDCRNSKNYNLDLSRRRAMAAINYLVCQGIDRCRLVGMAFGESQLKNNCECEGEEEADCSEAEHQENRRTMVKILSYDYKKDADHCQENVELSALAVKDAKENSAETTLLPTPDIDEQQVKEAGINMNPSVGYYIVVGTSNHPAYARNLAKMALKEGFDQADVLYLSQNKYFVYAKRFDTMDAARKELKDVRCCTRFPDAWIYVYKRNN